MAEEKVNTNTASGGKEETAEEKPSAGAVDVEEEETEEAAADEGSGGGFASVEGIIMLCIAVSIDATSLIITCFLLDDLGMLDVLGMIVIGGWMYTRSGANATVIRKGLKRFITSSVIELVPWLGGLSPCWTWLVYKTLKEG